MGLLPPLCVHEQRAAPITPGGVPQAVLTPRGGCEDAVPGAERGTRSEGAAQGPAPPRGCQQSMGPLGLVSDRFPLVRFQHNFQAPVRTVVAVLSQNS